MTSKIEEDDEQVEPKDAISESMVSSTPQTAQGTESQEVSKHQSHKSIPPVNSYQIKPNLQEKFKEIPVKEILKEVHAQVLGGQHYDPDRAKKWTISISNDVTEKVKDLEMLRYKHIVQVVLGEKKGQGVKAGVRCVWDCDVDGYTSEIFMNECLIIVVPQIAGAILMGNQELTQFLGF